MTLLRCRNCGRPFTEHIIYNDEAPPDAINAEFDVPMRGIYCPQE